jgi:hypothetical protein
MPIVNDKQVWLEANLACPITNPLKDGKPRIKKPKVQQVPLGPAEVLNACCKLPSSSCLGSAGIKGGNS